MAQDILTFPNDPEQRTLSSAIKEIESTYLFNPALEEIRDQVFENLEKRVLELEKTNNRLEMQVNYLLDFIKKSC